MYDRGADMTGMHGQQGCRHDQDAWMTSVRMASVQSWHAADTSVLLLLLLWLLLLLLFFLWLLLFQLCARARGLVVVIVTVDLCAPCLVNMLAPR